MNERFKTKGKTIGDVDWMAEREARIAMLAGVVSRGMAREGLKPKVKEPRLKTPRPARPPAPLHLHSNGQWYTTRRINGRKHFWYFGTDLEEANRSYAEALPELLSGKRPPRLADKWDAIVAAFEDPDVELTNDEFAPFLDTFNRLVAGGRKFDRAFVALVRMLERQMTGGESDGDADDADHLLSECNSSWATHAEAAGVPC